MCEVEMQMKRELDCAVAPHLSIRRLHTSRSGGHIIDTTHLVPAAGFGELEAAVAERVLQQLAQDVALGASARIDELLCMVARKERWWRQHGYHIVPTESSPVIPLASHMSTFLPGRSP
jgi:hypothetical protein